jgi:hypothetical protein
MNLDDLPTTAVAQLIALYRDAAASHGEFSENGNHRAANEAASLISAIYSELRRRGDEAQKALLPLLEDSAVGTRLWAASHALEFCSAKGEASLKQIASNRSLLGLSAATTLNEWRAGNLRFR